MNYQNLQVLQVLIIVGVLHLWKNITWYLRYSFHCSRIYL